MSELTLDFQFGPVYQSQTLNKRIEKNHCEKK